MSKQERGLFADEDLPTYWEEHWWGMPEFSNKDLEPVKQVIVSFASWDELDRFSEVVGQSVTARTQSLWFVPQEIGTYKDKSYE